MPCTLIILVNSVLHAKQKGFAEQAVHTNLLTNAACALNAHKSVPHTAASPTAAPEEEPAANPPLSSSFFPGQFCREEIM